MMMSFLVGTWIFRAQIANEPQLVRQEGNFVPKCLPPESGVDPFFGGGIKLGWLKWREDFE